MIVVVGMNPALDRILSVPNFSVGATLKADSVTVLPAGKGANVAAVLRVLGAPVRYTGFVGRGEIERYRERLDGVPCAIVSVDGETRTDTTIIDPVHGTETHVREPGFVISRNIVSKFSNALLVDITRGDTVVLAGSLPPGASDDSYAEIIRECHKRGATTSLDSSGRALKAGAAAVPTLLKPNREELHELTDRPVDSIDDILAAADELIARGVGAVAVSLGVDGAVLIANGSAWHGRADVPKAVNTVGCGDAFVAGWTAARVEGRNHEDQLREALSVAAANAMTSGAGIVEVEHVKQMRQIAVIKQIRS